MDATRRNHARISRLRWRGERLSLVPLSWTAPAGTARDVAVLVGMRAVGLSLELCIEATAVFLPVRILLLPLPASFLLLLVGEQKLF